MQVSASRVVTFLAPILAAGVAVGTAWLSKHTGLKVDPTEATAFGVTGATGVVTLALKWLHGNSLWERGVAVAAQAVTIVNAADPGLVTAAEGAVESAATKGEAKLVAVIAPVPEELAPAAFPPPAPVPDPALGPAA